ncbi:hypothetical protein HDG32_004899 [Paraburkholderia sp. CI2]|nr:hypothetical protein [Paraburkholderia sp. CI2]
MAGNKEHPNRITDWKKQLQERVAEVFETGQTSAEPPVDVKVLHAKIGQLTRKRLSWAVRPVRPFARG